MQGSNPSTELEAGNLERLRGASWNLNGEQLHISDERAAYSKTAVRRGGEALIVPLLDEEGDCRWYFKVFSHATEDKKRRSKWLTTQQIPQWTTELRAAPDQWIDTRISGRPDGAEFDMEGCLASAAPGDAWRDYKFDVVESKVVISDAIRRRWAMKLIRATATLEQNGFIHGDLSAANIIVKPATGDLYLIDLDAFVSRQAPKDLQRLPRGKGGAVGTEGYMPVDMEACNATDDLDACPYSDRRARDILLLELLCFDHTFPKEEAASTWKYGEYKDRLKKVEPESLGSYLLQRDILTLSESDRLSAQKLAELSNFNIGPQVQPTTSIQQSSTHDGAWELAGTLTTQALAAVYVTQWFLLGLRLRGAFPSVLSVSTVDPTLANGMLGWSIIIAATVFGIRRASVIGETKRMPFAGVFRQSARPHRERQPEHSRSCKAAMANCRVLVEAAILALATLVD